MSVATAAEPNRTRYRLARPRRIPDLEVVPIEGRRQDSGDRHQGPQDRLREEEEPDSRACHLAGLRAEAGGSRLGKCLDARRRPPRCLVHQDRTNRQAA